MKTWMGMALATALAASLVTGSAAVAAPSAAPAVDPPAPGETVAYHQFVMKVSGITKERVVAALDPMPAGSYVVTFSTVIKASAKASGTFRCQLYNAVSGGEAVVNSTPVSLEPGESEPFAVTVPVLLDAQAAIAARCKASGKGLSITAWRSDITAVSVTRIVDF